MSGCTPKFWMYNWNTEANACTFIANLCPTCRRYWDEDLRAMVGANCLLESYFPTTCPVKFTFVEPILHLPLDDNYASPKVYDSIGVFPQTFTDPSGDPNTNAHSVAGHVSNALQFDGTDDQITLTDESWQPYLEANLDFTLAIWAKANTPSPTANLHFLSNTTGAANGLAFTFNNNQYFLRFVVVSGGTPYVVFYTVPGTIDANWHHFAITRFGYTITLYFDGSAVQTSTNALYAAAAYTAGRSLILGCRYDSSNYAPCDLDEFRIYTRALSSAEIAVLAT